MTSPAPSPSLHLLLLLLLLSGECVGDYSDTAVIQTSRVKLRHLVTEGSQVRLSCGAGRPWMLCLWKSPINQNFCVLNLEHQFHRYSDICNKTEAGTRDPRHVVFVTPHTCDISFKVKSIPKCPPDLRPDLTPLKARRADHGIWRCGLTSGGHHQSPPSFTDLGVALSPLTSITVPGGDINTGTVHLEENKEYNLTCTVSQAFPRLYLL